jgi:hypothetical protein
MYREHRWPEKESYKAISKREEIRKAYGVTVPIFEVENGGEPFLSIVYPLGLMPKKHRKR